MHSAKPNGSPYHLPFFGHPGEQWSFPHPWGFPAEVEKSLRLGDAGVAWGYVLSAVWSQKDVEGSSVTGNSGKTSGKTMEKCWLCQQKWWLVHSLASKSWISSQGLGVQASPWTSLNSYQLKVDMENIWKKDEKSPRNMASYGPLRLVFME